ncbi:MAG: ABC transporter permease [Chloroflexota bacterium]|nr:ABC transporter permease [Chloroflexota bacterium]
MHALARTRHGSHTRAAAATGGGAHSLAERTLRGVAICSAAALVLFLSIPLVAMFWRLARDGRGVTPEALATLRDAMTLSLLTTAVAMAIVVTTGVPLAFFLARRPFPGSRVIDTLVDLPIVLPPAVAGIALLVAFGRNGMVGRWLATMGVTVGFTTTAVVLAQVFVAAPFFVRAAKSGFQRVDLDLEEAAADLGASPLRTLRTVTFPMALPSLMAGAVLAWARALGEFGATIMFAGNFPGVTQTMPLAIYARFGAGDLTSALILSLVLLIASVIVLFGLRLLASRTGTPVM